MDKPITVIISEFKENFANLLNDAQLPAWLLLILMEPFINQLKQLSTMQEEEDRRRYEEGESENGNDDNPSVTT